MLELLTTNMKHIAKAAEAYNKSCSEKFAALLSAKTVAAVKVSLAGHDSASQLAQFVEGAETLLTRHVRVGPNSSTADVNRNVLDEYNATPSRVIWSTSQLNALPSPPSQGRRR